MPHPSPCTVLSVPQGWGAWGPFPGINPSEGTIKLFFFSLCDCFFSRVLNFSRLTLFLPGPPAELEPINNLRWMGHLAGS